MVASLFFFHSNINLMTSFPYVVVDRYAVVFDHLSQMGPNCVRPEILSCSVGDDALCAHLSIHRWTTNLTMRMMTRVVLRE